MYPTLLAQVIPLVLGKLAKESCELVQRPMLFGPFNMLPKPLHLHYRRRVMPRGKY